jgi:hypothetical protein
MKEKVTILIQGPLNNISLENIKNYEKFGPIIVSHWDVEPSEIKYKFPIISKLKRNKRIKFVSRTLPNLEKKIGILKDSTFYWALESTYNGITECETEYVVKTRSDEYFTNLKPIITKALKFEGKKFVCGNIFIRDYKEYPMHIGDHVFCLKTSDMFLMYKNLYKMYNKLQKFESWAKHGPTTAEQIIGYSFLKYVKQLTSDDISKSLCPLKPSISGLTQKPGWVKKIFEITPLPLNKILKIIYVNLRSWILRHMNIIDAKKKNFLKKNFYIFNYALESTYVIDINCLGQYQVSWAHLKMKWNSKKNKFTNCFEKIQNQNDLIKTFYK